MCWWLQRRLAHQRPTQAQARSAGPSRRSCTDVICCVLFLLFLLGYTALGIVGEFPAAPRGWRLGAVTRERRFPCCSPRCPCRPSGDCVSVSSVGVWRPPASPLPQELHGGLLRHGGQQVSTPAGGEGGMGQGPPSAALSSLPCGRLAYEAPQLQGDVEPGSGAQALDFGSGLGLPTQVLAVWPCKVLGLI